MKPSAPLFLFFLFSSGSALAQTEEALPPPPPPAEAPPAEQEVAPAQPLPPPPPPKQAEPAPPPAAEPAPPPQIVVATPPPPPPVQRGYHYHDGFYLRLSLGIGASSHSVSTDRFSYPDYSVGGGGLGFDLMIGGSPAPGVAIGGILLAQGATNAEIDVEGVETSADANTAHSLLGIFIDGFPRPNGGFNVGGALGLASAVIEPEGGRKFQGGGFGAAAWVGYTWWVAGDWSLGGLLRFNGSLARQEEEDLTQQTSSFGASLLFTALCH